MAIVADTGGTSFDVSLVRRDRIPWTRETWLGPRFRGHMTGFPSVDVKSIGAGGGSIARVDEGGLLQVGPGERWRRSRPGLLRPRRASAHRHRLRAGAGLSRSRILLGGAIRLDARRRPRRGRARRGPPARHVGATKPLPPSSAVATENMVSARSRRSPVNQGIDPARRRARWRRRRCRLQRRRHRPPPRLRAAAGAGGGRRLECGRRAHLRSLHRSRASSSCGRIPRTAAAINAVLAELAREAEAFARGPGAGAVEHRTEFVVEARYPQQTWEIEVPLRRPRFDDARQVQQLVEDFHAPSIASSTPSTIRPRASSWLPGVCVSIAACK